MPPPPSSPARSARAKRESLSITRAVGKAFSDVMNKDKHPSTTSSSTESDAPRMTSTPTDTRGIGLAASKRMVATTREGQRTGRPSLDLPRSGSGNDKPSPKLTKRPMSASAARTTSRQDKSAPPAPPYLDGKSPSQPGEKTSKPRSSLTLRGLTSALQPKPDLPPSALPKYKTKGLSDAKPTLPRSGTRKRLSDWDEDKEVDKESLDTETKSSDEGGEEEFVTVERPISPLPRRVARKTILPVSLSLTPSTPPKRTNVLHKASSSVSSSTPSRPPKTAKTSTTPIARLQQYSVPRPSSSASTHSLRTTPVLGSRRPVSPSRSKTASSTRPARRRPVTADSALSSGSKLEASPANPFQLPETSGNSLLSPPLSPFLEGVSLDSLDAGDVSAFLSTVVSPTKPPTASAHVNADAPPQTPSQGLLLGPVSPPPQTPVSLRPVSGLTTDPRQSVLSLRQFLENSGDLEHLLSQPLPSILTPDARERLLSFGFSPGIPPPPFPPSTTRSEPETPCPVANEQKYTSISQVLFPTTPTQASTEQQPPSLSQPHAEKLDLELANIAAGGATVVELLKMQLASAETQRAERDARIKSLEQQLISSREARAREAADLSTQVSDLEKQLTELLSDRDRESGRRAQELEGRLRDKDAEWECQIAAAVSQVQEQGAADQMRILSAERRKACVRGAAAAWECTREAACAELELIRSNKSFVQVTLAGLDVVMQQLRHH